MADTRIGAVVVDAQAVAKAGFRSFIEGSLPHLFSNADAVRAEDLSPMSLVYILALDGFFAKDTASSDPDNGVSIIIDIAGNHFALQSSPPNILTQRVVTAAGAISMVASDDIILVNKIVGAATVINMVTAVGRTQPVFIKDLKGDAATNAITPTPDGVETIDGLTSAAITFNGGGLALYPLGDGSGWFIL